jgi:hypothetical protein
MSARWHVAACRPAEFDLPGFLPAILTNPNGAALT